MQIGLTLMAERFPYAKGKATKCYSAAVLQPYYSVDYGSSAKMSDIMWFDTAIAAIGFLLALFIGLRQAKKRGVAR